MLPALALPAHHMAVLAIPAVLPAVIVVGVVLFIAVRDRREQRRKSRQGEDAE
ncbi:MAG: hypothetical protein ACJ71Z_05085 [Aeromicrobium sp.]